VEVPSVNIICPAPQRACAGESDAEIVAGAWDFERINRRYARHLRVLAERPGGALRNAAAEREAWLDAVTNDHCCRAGYCRRIIWGNRHGGRLLRPAAGGSAARRRPATVPKAFGIQPRKNRRRPRVT